MYIGLCQLHKSTASSLMFKFLTMPKAKNKVTKYERSLQNIELSYLVIEPKMAYLCLLHFDTMNCKFENPWKNVGDMIWTMTP